MQKSEPFSMTLSLSTYDRALSFLDQKGVDHFEISQIKEEFFQSNRKKTWGLLNQKKNHDSLEKVKSSPFSSNKQFTLMASPLSSEIWQKRLNQAKKPTIFLQMENQQSQKGESHEGLGQGQGFHENDKGSQARSEESHKVDCQESERSKESVRMQIKIEGRVTETKKEEMERKETEACSCSTEKEACLVS